MKRFGKFLIIFIILILIFIGMLVAACTFPSSAIKDNVRASSMTLSKEGNRKRIFMISKFQFEDFDNYSDALMINTAYSIDSKTPLYSAFTAKKDYIPGVTKTIKEDVVGELKSNSKYSRHDEVSELEDTVNGEGEESFEYAKYWHGYLAFLRPLLLILDYQQIRVFLTLIFALLAIYITTSIAEQKSIWIASFYLLSLVFIDYFYIGLSLINSVTFLIMMISSLFLIKKYKSIKDFGLFFFIIGMFVGFFTLLDAPLLTFGMPIILYFIYKDGDGKNDFKDLIKFLIYWGLGYFLTWMTKWVLMDLFFSRNLLETAIGQVLYRSVGKGVPWIIAICINMAGMAIPLLVAIFIIVYMIIKYAVNVTKESRRRGRIFAMIVLMPFAWYILLPNHSVYHVFFSYRLLFISIFACLLWVYHACGKLEKKNGE